MGYPRILRIRQHFDRPRVEDIPATVAAQLERLDLGRRIKPGQSVALTAGSRGIANIPVVLKATADFLKRLGASPFLIPTMGSHGGGTAEGQRKIIESYGITEEFVGVPIRASMDTIAVGTAGEGFPVYLDKHASEADHIGVVGRIKPHTGFSRPHRERPAEDDDDRPGQAHRGADVPPHPARAALGRHRAQRRPRR